MVDDNKINQIIVEKVENGYLVIEHLNNYDKSLFGLNSVSIRKFHIASDGNNVAKVVSSLLNKLCTASETKQLKEKKDDDDDDNDELVELCK